MGCETSYNERSLYLAVGCHDLLDRGAIDAVYRKAVALYKGETTPSREVAASLRADRRHSEKGPSGSALRNGRLSDNARKTALYRPFSGAERWSGWSWQSRENAVNSFFVRVGLLPTAGHTPRLTKTSKDARQCSHKALEIRYLLGQDGVSEQ
jgi:hypothetical protein